MNDPVLKALYAAACAACLVGEALWIVGWHAHRITGNYRRLLETQLMTDRVLRDVVGEWADQMEPDLG